MVIDYFKNIFQKYLKKDNHIVSPLVSEITPKEYFYKPLEVNHSDIQEFKFSQEEYLLFQEQHLNNKFFLNEKNKIVLEKIHEDLSLVLDIFKPFKTQHIGLEIILTGGSLRDFILGKSEFINDLDIIVNFSPNYKQFLMYQFCHKPSDVIGLLLKEKDISFNTSSDTKKNFERIDVYDHLHHLLEEVTEFQGKHFPIQLFSTDSPKHLIDNFDIDISKVSLKFFWNDYLHQETSVPANIDEYISRLYCSPDFIYHAIHKKISYHNECKNEDQIYSEITQHLPRILEKYPEFSFGIFSPDIENADFSRKLLDKLSSYQKLNKNLKEKDSTSVKKHKI